ncbi:MAG TPA: alpha-(1-_3)-arabinofuranosyltransferase family protein [Acidimicrobiales bacterium]|nr:alpha-(1->3)-arabinofuranosyltransferase family protein [Acidimicrobiales bacterium]
MSSLARGPLAYALVAVLAYVPMLLTKPGVVSDDTKTYLYLDPGKWLRSAVSMWDPDVALGTVTHQKIGYLLPMGPFYWATAAVHLPVWVAQRLWLGSILFAAAAGVLYLCTLFGIHGVGRLVAAVAYAFTPYVMQYAGRVSVLLLPFAGLPWMVGFIVQALRRPGWKYPAAFALTVALVGGINASSLVYVGVAPLLWLPYAVFVTREATGAQAWRTFWRAGVLTVLGSLWWISGLVVEGAYGINILKYTESVQATSSTTAASEVIRGLGYWYFYGADRLGLWTAAAQEFTEKLWLLALTYLAPVAAFVAAACTRWRARAYFVVLLVVGMTLSVAAHPFDDPTAVGSLAKAVMTKTTAGFALRSTDRATPVVVLALAMLLGAGVAALARRFTRAGVLSAVTIGALVLAADAPLLAGRTVISQFSQPASLPAYTAAAAARLNAGNPGTRVYALPGNNFAAYRYGDTVDPIWPALLTRPFVTREQLIQGSQATADLLYALDNPLQQGTMNWAALAPIARLMSVGDVLVQYDQANERYGTPEPLALAHDLSTVPPGLAAPVTFGTPTLNVPTIPVLDETAFGLPQSEAPPPPLASYAVPGTRPLVRAEPLQGALVVDGDAVGLVQAAGLGRLSGDPTVFYAASLASAPGLAHQVLGPGSQLVVTDSNRKQAFEWNSLLENVGYTQTASEHQSAFESNYPDMAVFPGAPTSAQTTTVLGGDVASVSASAYGTAYTLRPEFRPANAIDGDLRTAWETEGTAGFPVGQWWQVTLKAPTTAGAVTLTQPQTSTTAPWLTNQWITKVTLSFDGGHPVTVDLGAASRGPGGETVVFPTRTFRTLRITIDGTNLASHGSVPPGSSLVGFAEVGIHDVHVAQVVSLPTDLLDKLGTASTAHRLTFVLTRDRVAPVPPRSDPEPAMTRQFTLPASRTFSVSGTARISTLVPDATVAALVGLPASPGSSSPGSAASPAAPTATVVAATSSSRLPGDLQATAYATLDHDPTTAWDPGLGIDALDHPWLAYTFDRPVTLDHLDLLVASDAQHSVPTAVTVTGDSGSTVVPLAPIPTTPGRGSQTTVHVSFPPVTGTHLRITFSAIAVRTTQSYETSLVTGLPIAVAEVTIPGVASPAMPATIPSPCRSDLLRIDGRPVSVEVSGSTAAALGGSGLAVTPCGADAGGLTLGPGPHLLEAADGAGTGVDLDQLVLDSAPGGGPEPAGSSAPGPGTGAGTPAPATDPAGPQVTVTSRTATTIRLRVRGATSPFLLVLGESLNTGWQASVDGGPGLGDPVLVDGYANGWELTRADLSAAHGGTLDVTLRFAPQRLVDVSLVVSALTLAACAAMVGYALVQERRARRSGAGPAPAVPAAEVPGLVSPLAAGRPSASAMRTIVGTVLAGACAWALGGWLAGVLVAACVALAMTTRRGGVLLRAGSAVMLAAAAAAVVGLQALDHFHGNAGWPGFFDVASAMVWAAVLLLGADAGLEMVRDVRAGRARRAGRGARPPG